MCGICGILDVDGVARESIERMSASLAHRGPDDHGFHLEPGVALGHRRLSIIDLDGGHQPIASDDGKIWLVFNGEIYNYKQLRSELERDAPFRTHSDTEVLVRLYEKYGTDCLSRIRGMFAFAIWDAPRKRLFAARDHLGQKPFYYHHAERRFAFASEIKALLAWDPGLRELGPEGLTEYLALRIITPPRSMFRRVSKLPPGHFLVYEDGKLSVERYWDVAFEPKVTITFEEAVEELDRRMHDAVEHHLVSDVEVGAFLSGGLDSSLVVASMARHAGSGIKTFSGDLPYAGRSELPYARDVASKFATDNHELTITPSLVEDLPRVLWHLDEPSDPLSTCLFALSRMIREHVKVVLGGDGGDELFAGYDRYYGYRYAGYLALVPRAVRAGLIGPLLRALPAGSWYRGMSHRAGWMLRMAEHSGATRYAKSLRYFYYSDEWLGALFTERFRRSVAAFDPEQAICREFDAVEPRETVDRMLHADSATRMPDHPVMLLDRMTMAHGLEARSPFLDHELAGFCAALPPSYKLRGTQRRLIQMALARRYLPESVLRRDKQGFSSAFPYMMAQQFHRLYETLLGEASLVSAGILEADPIARLLREQRERREDHGTRLWLLCNAELWYRLGIEGRSVETVREEIRSALGESRAVPA